MTKGRLEAFTDGVMAVLITILVLELKVPHGSDLQVLAPLLPTFLTYVLSFVYLGIYWNNHHHMLHATGRVTGGILWANLHLLFWLSLVPFTTGWMGENHFAPTPTAVYGVVLPGAALAYYLLQARILAVEGRESPLAEAVGHDLKGKRSRRSSTRRRSRSPSTGSGSRTRSTSGWRSCGSCRTRIEKRVRE
jgi:uncharacterized membrane protein